MAKVDAGNAGLKPAYSFEQLVIGPHNQVAAAACSRGRRRAEAHARFRQRDAP